VRLLGVLELTIAALFVIPRTAPIGLLGVVAYLGGATAIHVRADDPFIAPVALGVVAVVAFGLRRHDLVKAAFARG
jgi:DoxX-like family